MQKITCEQVLDYLDEELVAELQKGVPTEIEQAVKRFLDGFERDYREHIARRIRAVSNGERNGG